MYMYKVCQGDGLGSNDSMHYICVFLWYFLESIRDNEVIVHDLTISVMGFAYCLALL